MICVGGDLCTKFEGDAEGSIVGSLTNSKDSSVTVAGLLPFSRFFNKINHYLFTQKEFYILLLLRTNCLQFS